MNNIDLNLTEVVLGVFTFLTALASGSALTAWVKARSSKQLTAAEAEKVGSESMSTILSGAAGALFANMQKEMERQGEAIRELELKIKSRDNEIDKLEEENRRLHEENFSLSQAVAILKQEGAELQRRVEALEGQSGTTERPSREEMTEEEDNGVVGGEDGTHHEDHE